MLSLIVFINGLAVMVLEMTGARLLAPELGTSIIVWTSLIGVILASLSAGYWLGGRLADTHMRAPEMTAETKKTSEKQQFRHEQARQRNARSVLSMLLTLAAVAVFASSVLGMFIQGRLSTLFPSLHLAAVCSALALFALPSLLCGMVSPYAVRLAITSGNTAGSVIGRLNAIGTVGSIAGTFLGGFVLLAWFSTNTILFGVSACLLLAALLVRPRPLLPKLLLALIAAGAITADIHHTNAAAQSGPDESGSVSVETAYASMRVGKGTFEGRPALFLLTDPGSAQSGMFLDAPSELMFPYTKFYALGTALQPQAKRILMLGGGGYSVPKWLLAGKSGLTSRDFSLDVVELDPGMSEVAATYFAAPLRDPRLAVFHEDARTFINGAAKGQGEYGPYDLIFADTFNSWYSVPFHMGTVEAAANIKKLLAKDGIYVMNIISAVSGDNGRLLRAIRAAFLEHFETVHIFPVHSAYNGTIVQNVMLLVFRDSRSLPDPAKETVSPGLARLLAQRWTPPFPAPEDDVPALRDGYAPVERYTLGFLP